MASGITITGNIAATTLISPESNIFGNLSLKVKKLLILAGHLKTIFNEQNFNLSVNKL